MNYIKKFWNGDVPLVISYWLVGVLVSFPVGLVIGFLSMALSPHDGGIGLSKLLTTGWMVFISFGVWRSSDKYWKNPKNQGRKGWAIVAKIAVVIGWVQLFHYIQISNISLL